MEWWQVGAAMNGILLVVYLMIATAIVVPLMRGRQLLANPLGLATAGIFFTCAIHHGSHTFHMVLPVFGIHSHSGFAMRDAFHWQIALWDVATAAVGVYYWTLRRTYAPLMQGAKLFEDMKDRQRQALEINDNIVQGLTVAQMALAMEDRDKSEEALQATMISARRIITELLGSVDNGELQAGAAVREQAADLQRTLEDVKRHP